MGEKSKKLSFRNKNGNVIVVGHEAELWYEDSILYQYTIALIDYKVFKHNNDNLITRGYLFIYIMTKTG